ncbi:tyrosine-protein kinase STYK1-like [Gastrophryne carolinensis]
MVTSRLPYSSRNFQVARWRGFDGGDDPHGSAPRSVTLLPPPMYETVSMNSSEDFCHNDGGWQDAVIVIPALLSVSTLVIVVVILWKSIRKIPKAAAGESTADAVGGGWAVNVGGAFENPLEAPDPTLELPRDWRIEDRVVMCRGHYGPISWAVLVRAEDRREVVLKELSESCSPGEAQDFTDLLRFYVRVCNHDNLPRPLWCHTHRSPVCLITEAMTLGNLLMFLRESHQSGGAFSITERDVCSMASQVASGLEYLSGSHNLVHGYVAACNVLLHEDLSVRLCGLGLAAIQHRTGSVPASRASRVPVKWQSPERLRGGGVTTESDVWSFGILLYEMVTLGAPPYPDVAPADLPKKLQKIYRMATPRQCGERLYDVMASCWQWEAPQRPTFGDLQKRLQNALSESDGGTALTACDALTWPDYLCTAGIPS